MILREAIQHIPLSQYAYAPDEEHLTIRLRAGRGNLAACTLYYGDRAQDGDPIRFTPMAMSVAASDELFDYFELTFAPGLARVCYYFELAAADETVLYCADLFMAEVPPTRSEFYQYPYIRREEISDVPAWFKEAVVYNIFPDSFASGEERLSGEGKCIPLESGGVSKSKLGGTLRGIIANLGYIKGLGFNCLYLNPIFTAGEYHKYDLIDYFGIDPCFGTDEDFAELVDTAHRMGMRVIVDGVFNHCGRHFFAFEDVVQHGRASQYWDWFYNMEAPVVVPVDGEYPNYSCFAYVPHMPKLNTSNPHVRNYFVGVCRYWVRKYHIDGWRLDVANEVDREFWRAFRRALKEENPEGVLIAEIWESAESWLRGDMFDSTMNYDFRKHCRDFFALGAIDAAEFDARATQMRMRYPAGIVQGQLNLLDSHDVSRFLSLCGGDVRRFKLAVLFLAVFPGVPSVFYGDELCITGIEEPEYRQPMPWGAKTDLTEFFRQVLALRQCPAVILGSYKVLCAGKGESIYAIERSDGTNTVTLILNASGDSQPIDAKKFPGQRPTLFHGWDKSQVEGFGFAVWALKEGG